MFRQAKRQVVMVRLHTLSSWLPKHKGFARRYAHESCYGFRVTSEVTSSIVIKFFYESSLVSLPEIYNNNNNPTNLPTIMDYILLLYLFLQ